MSFLDHSTKTELLSLLSPLLDLKQHRRAILAFALGSECPVLHRVDWEGAVHPFVLKLIDQLDDFGEIEPGKPALWCLLLGIRGMVGVDRQARIDALEPRLHRPVERRPTFPSSFRWSPSSSLGTRGLEAQLPTT